MSRQDSLRLLQALVTIALACPALSQAQFAQDTSMFALPARIEVVPAMECASLAHLDFSRVPVGPARIRGAAIEPATATGPEACIVKGYVAPTIRFELHLPTHGYTGRYLQGGCGGNCGIVPNSVAPGCDNALAFGGSFAVGFEDSGHDGGDGVWALGGEQVRIDFAHRAAHAFAQAAKAIVTAYYGRPPEYSYFLGCSDGGREGMAESQRYPADFNGVVAGAPAHRISAAMERFLWEARYGNDERGQPVFSEPSLRHLHETVMAACDGLDGLVDGQIDDPRRCHYDPTLAGCVVDRSPDCLDASQVEAARRYYEGPRDEHGVALYTGGEPYGAELSWGGRISLASAGGHMLDDYVRSMVYQGKLPDSVTVRNWRFDLATFHDLERHGALFDAADPDLRPFRKAGGRLILWYGAADSAAGAFGVPDYYQQVQDVVGGMAAARGFVRVFSVPAVYHCGSGYIAYQFDPLGAIVRWVELGEAPDALVASGRLADGTLRTRPVYAYPVMAHYRGSGDINDAANFEGLPPATPPMDRFDWAGARRGTVANRTARSQR